MNKDMSAVLLRDFDQDAICYLPRTWCKACGEATRQNRRPSACQQHDVKPCPKCRTRITTAHVDLDYVGHADVRHRLCEADPEWTWAPYLDLPGGALVMDGGSPVGFWILLTVGGVTKPGYGSCDRGKPEAVKELIGDALRNAALSFGVAWKLWAKGDREDKEGDRAASHTDQDAEAPQRPARKRQRPPERPAADPVRAPTTGADHERLRHGTVEATPDDRAAQRTKRPLPDDENVWQDQPPNGKSKEQGRIGVIQVHFDRLGVTDRSVRLGHVAAITGHAVTTTKDLTEDEQLHLLDVLTKCKNLAALEQQSKQEVST